jgi:CRISPR-associated protein Csx17
MTISLTHYRDGIPGATVTPMPGLAAGEMGAWLAAAGILRMTARADAAAGLYWDGPVPCLVTGSQFPLSHIADQAGFTPVVTAWQAGGGWGAKDKTPRERIAALRGSRSPRLAAYRAAIVAADRVLAAHPDSDKLTLVRELRNWLPDEALPWLDAAVPLRSEHGDPGTLTVGFAPLAGTGGNDGRWDLSTTCAAAVLALDPDRDSGPAAGRRRAWLDDLAGGTESTGLLEMSSGPYWPAAAAAGLANPWAVVLMAEGLCVFGDGGHIGVFEDRHQPWTASLGPDAAEPGWGEAWLPMWDQPMTMSEVRVVLAGPLPSWRGRPAATAAGMYASLRSAGWPAGITGYTRYGLVRRRGLAHVAVPLDVVTPQALPPEEWLGVKAAAARARVAERTWTGYVARGQAPQPRHNPRTGRPEWLATTVDAWLRLRPGQGARTDLD